MALLLRYAIRSHVGLIREGNEDSGYAGPRLLAIADGMGGAAAGELASSVVLSTMARLDEPAEPGRPGGQSVSDTLQISAHDLAALEAGVPAADQPLMGEPDLAALGGAVVTANERLRAIVAERPELEGMGTTLTAMLWSGGRFGMVHVGDSRAYRLRDGLLEQMTADHTWVQRLIDEGRITEEEAGHHPQRSLLMRALDGRTQVEADIGTFDAFAGDRYLLCSDGLSGFVSQETLAETLAAYQDPQQAVDALIELALRAGGPDNITCIVADTLDDGSNYGQGPNEATQLLGSVTPVVVGAASEGVDRLPHFSGQPAQPGPGEHPGAPAPPPDDFPQNHPAGRAARLRPRRGGAAQQLAQPPHPGAPLPPGVQYDPSEVTAELSPVPGGAPMPGAPMPEPVRSRSGGGPDGEGPRKRGKKPLVVSGVVVLALAGAAFGGYQWTQGKYYVGVSDDGKVIVYQGISQTFLGLGLSSQASATIPTVYVQELPTSSQAAARDDDAMSLSAAEAKVAEYKGIAQACHAYRHAPKNVALSASKQDSAITPGTAANVAAPGPGPLPGPTTAAATAPATVGATGPGQVPATGTVPPTAASPTAGQVPPSSAPGPSQDMKAFCAGSQDGPEQ